MAEALAGEYDVLVLTRQGNLAYAAGFPDAMALVMDLRTGEATLYVSRLDYWRAKEAADVDRVVGVAGVEVPARRPGEELAVTTDLQSHLRGTLSGRVASDGGLGTDVGQRIMQVRAVKDEEEVGLMRRALEITEGVFSRLASMRLEGMRERDVAALAYRWMLEDGADGVAFEPIVASGRNGAYPHYRYGDRRVRGDEYVVVDLGARYGLYCADMTRTLGRSEALKDAYYAVLEALAAAEKAARPGAPAAEVDRAAREVLRQYGYDRHYIHSTGHGVGVEVHEAPRLSPASSEVLREGMVVTIEPGVYVEGVGGVRIEDMVHVGWGVLNRLARSL